MPPETKTAAPELLKIGDFARMAGTNLRTLRYYEELGLLHPASRSRGGFRYYRTTDVSRMRLISSLQELGLSLEEIRDLTSVRDASGNGNPARDAYFARVRGALEGQLDLFARRIAELEERRGRLTEAMRKLDDCDGCIHTPSPDNNYCEPCSRTARALPEELSALF